MAIDRHLRKRDLDFTDDHNRRQRKSGVKESYLLQLIYKFKAPVTSVSVLTANCDRSDRDSPSAVAPQIVIYRRSRLINKV